MVMSKFYERDLSRRFQGFTLVREVMSYAGMTLTIQQIFFRNYNIHQHYEQRSKKTNRRITQEAAS
ncbi:hypothetical protein HYALB_00007122 [Hymenoscyphus albidus]|uniref:Uncharacterized protein n=1 Tax=Hymenoscyphus albidus TaxID=595503 RepID=A0A9N9LZ13_9HELO|nr:hypothetical protein HYALB_00007122 [Hymenoscyphus albidus]